MDRKYQISKNGRLKGDATSERWSVPWSDLMMTMFILFFVLFIIAAGQAQHAENKYLDLVKRIDNSIANKKF